MKKSKINFEVSLDDNNIPEKIEWSATDADLNKPQNTNAITVSTWDDQNKNTLRIDLWTKDMPVDELKLFYIDCVGGLAQSLLNATGDEYMSNEMKELCAKLSEYMKKELG